MPALDGEGAVGLEHRVRVGREDRVEVRVERQVAGLAEPGGEAGLADVVLDVGPRPRVGRIGRARACVAAHPAMTPSSRPTRGERRRAPGRACSSRVRGGHDRPDPRPVEGDGREHDGRREHALVEQAVARTGSSVSRSPRITGVIGVSLRPVSKPEPRQLRLEPPGVGPQALVQLRLLLHDPDRLAARGGDGGRVARGEQERPRALDEDVAQGLRARDVAAEDADRLATASRPGSRPGRRARSGRPTRGRPRRARPRRARRRPRRPRRTPRPPRRCPAAARCRRP